MQSKKSINSFIAMGLVAILFSCNDVELDLKDKQNTGRLVVNGLINTMDNPQIVLSNSTSIDLSTLPEFIQNGLVTLEDETGKKDTLKYDFFKEVYTKNMTIVAGKTYKINASTAKYGNSYGSTTVPASSVFGNAYWKDSTSFDKFDFPLGSIFVTVKDDPTTNNFYRISLYFWNTSSFKWEVLKPEYNDNAISEYGFLSKTSVLAFGDQGISGSTKTIAFTTPTGFAGQSPKFRIELESLNEDAYKYYNSMRKYNSDGSSIFDEATPVFSNLQNGLGIFGASVKQIFIIN